MDHPNVSGVCTDSSGRVYVYSRSEHPVMVYDRSGLFLGSWGEELAAPRDGVPSRYLAHGASMTPDDTLILVDHGTHSVRRYALDGTELQTIGPVDAPSDTGYSPEHPRPLRAAGPYNRPTHASVSPDGEVYVSDGYGNARVHRFGEGGALLESWGGVGSEAGQFILPHSLCVLPDGRVLVADRQNERIQIFDRDGRYLTEWTDVQRPQDLAVDRDGLVYVAELSWDAGDIAPRRGVVEHYLPPRVSVLDSDGNLLLRWSGAPGTPGHFSAPHGIWVDDEGSVYVAEITGSFAVTRGLVPPGTTSLQKFERL
ncbi:peptidyl-alpha-hydroxyglycine alpha-amidating lyase family protein [Compostimonas suwonensis]|nr:peptidyl-alpha-hydroxyglycine alpha-amidating lyase family protein [Compostimonas suwonensis]